MSVGALRLIGRLAGATTLPPAGLYSDTWPGRARRVLQLGYHGLQWLRWRVDRGDAMVLAGHGLPAAKGPLELKQSITWRDWADGACVLRGASLESLAHRLGLDARPAPTLYCADADVLVVTGFHAQAPVVVHVCADAPRLARYAERATAARARLGTVGLADLVPEVFAQVPVLDVAMLTQARLPGHAVLAGALSADELRDHLAAALQPLRALQSAAASAPMAADESRIARLAADLNTIVEWRGVVEAPLAALLTWPGRRRLPAVLAHGDYWLSNLLFEQGRLTGVVDWERSRCDAVAGFDAFHLVAFSFAQWRGCPPLDVPCMLWDDVAEPVLERLFALIAAQLGLDRDDLCHIALLWWLMHLQHHAADRHQWGATRCREWLDGPARSAAGWLARRASTDH
jgi:hypothetical protein